LPARADSFLAGCLVGLVASWSWLPRARGPRRALQVGAWGAVPILAVLIARVPEGATAFYCGGLTLVLAAAALIVAAAVNAPPRPVAVVLGSPVLVWFGRISYGLYLWHFPMLTFVPGLVRRLVPALVENVVVVEGLEFSLAVAAAALSFYLVEQPLLRCRARGAGAGAKKQRPHCNVQVRASARWRMPPPYRSRSRWSPR
jgi:peptidoglycan/LPS O-acetylase OafA/YrhL